MERYTIEVPDEALASLREAASEKGVSVEAELGRLVEQTYAKRAEDDWVHALVAMTRPGLDFQLPSRLSWERETPFEFNDFS